MTEDKDFNQYRLWIINKFEHLKQENRQLKCDIEKLQAAIHKQEVEYAKDMNKLKGQIANLENASKTFPTRESVDIRLRNLEGYQDRMKGMAVAYGAIAAIVVQGVGILVYFIM